MTKRKKTSVRTSMGRGKRSNMGIDLSFHKRQLNQGMPTATVITAAYHKPGFCMPSEALKRIESIPLISETGDTPKCIAGNVIYDSWRQLHPPMTRDINDGYVRTLKAKAGRITLELVAERRVDDWDFVARIRNGSKVDHSYVLIAGSRRLLAGVGGYFHWTSKQVPRLLKLVSYKQQVVFESMSWQ
jgi:hypothetical protein